MHRPGSILVVDDDKSLTAVVAELLHARGFEVWAAYDGLQGFTSYLAHPTQFVITDIQMPELNGIEMMRCIRAINPDVKTIYVSGGAERFHEDLEMEEQGFAAILLRKPFASQDLIRLISDVPMAQPQYRVGKTSKRKLRQTAEF